MPHAERDGVLHETWRIAFRHSAGRLGSDLLAAHREGRGIRAWRSGAEATTLYPPRDLGGEGSWVEVGPGAELLSALPASSGGGSTLARVRLDGAACGMFARVLAPEAGLATGTRLTAQVGDAEGITFEPVPGR